MDSLFKSIAVAAVALLGLLLLFALTKTVVSFVVTSPESVAIPASAPSV